MAAHDSPRLLGFRCASVLPARANVTALRELAAGVLAIVGVAFGLLLISVFFETAVDGVEAWWHAPFAFAIALAATAVGLAAMFAAVRRAADSLTDGWLGMLSGHTPAGYGRRDGNLGQGLGNLLLFAGCAVLGVLWFRKGVRDGELNWAIEGLFFAVGGAVFGVLPAVPRLYFAARAGEHTASRREQRRRAERRATKSTQRDGSRGVAVFVTLAGLGIGLSLAVTNACAAFRLRDGRAALAYGDWADGCLDADGDVANCAPDARLQLIPRATRRLRLEHLGSCTVDVLDPSGSPAPRLSHAELRAIGVDPGGGDERARMVLDPEPGATYEVVITPNGDSVCTYSVRYFFERGRR